MQNYTDLMKDVLDNGVYKLDRTGVGSRSVFGRLLRWDLSEGFPIITTRKTTLRIAFEETMFFLRGHADTKLLEEKKINIWKGNTTREFLDARGLTHLPEGNMGRGYGVQWRHWQSPERVVVAGKVKNFITETDQIRNLLAGLKNDPYSRRHVVTGWNPGELHKMALPPCHMMHLYSIEGDFTVKEGKLNNCFFMRSNDVPYGLPFNIMSYALINHIFAKHLGLTPGETVYMGWDVHIYENQVDMCKEQVLREPLPLPELRINRDLTTFEDILNLEWSDIELIGYQAHPDFTNKPPMAT